MATHDTHQPKATAPKPASQAVQRTPESDVAEPEAERTERVAASPRAGRPSQQQARMMQRMQRTVGNAQVQRMLSGAAPARTQQPYVAPALQPPAMPRVQHLAQSTAAPSTIEQIPAADVQSIPDSTPPSIQRPAALSVATARPLQRTATPIARGWSDFRKNIVNAGKNFGNKIGELGQQGAKLAFEKALSAAGVDAKRVMGFINRAGGAVSAIISNPGRFANTLVGAVRQGFGRFQGNISTHLQSGFSGWLFGTMSGAGVSMPKDFSAPSILSMVLQVLGITPNALKQRVARQVGERNVGRMEQAWGAIAAVMKNGPGGLWTLLKEYLGDLKTVVIDGIKQWLITAVIKAAVIKIVSMFNPVSGIIAVIKTIYNVVTFFMERAKQIAALFSAIAGSVGALAQGNVQQAATKIEQVLARMIPVAIGFFASLVGLKGVAQKVKEIVGRVRDRIHSAIDKMIAKVVSKFKAVAQNVRGKPGTKPGAAQANAADDQRRLRQGVMAGVSAVNKLKGNRVGEAIITPILSAIRPRYRLGVLEPVVQDGYWAVHGEIRRMTELTKKQNDRTLSQADEQWDQAWRAKQAEVHNALQQFVPKFQALDPNATVHIRGSLASGVKMNRKKVGKNGERYLFNPSDFDIDAYIVSKDLFESARRKDPNRAARGDIPGSVLPSVNRIIKEMRPVLGEIFGNRDTGALEYQFNVYIRPPENAQKTTTKDRGRVSELGLDASRGNPITVKPPDEDS